MGRDSCAGELLREFYQESTVRKWGKQVRAGEETDVVSGDLIAWSQRALEYEWQQSSTYSTHLFQSVIWLSVALQGRGYNFPEISG